jgi:hypothetical protein
VREGVASTGGCELFCFIHIFLFLFFFFFVFRGIKAATADLQFDFSSTYVLLNWKAADSALQGRPDLDAALS